MSSEKRDFDPSILWEQVGEDLETFEAILMVFKKNLPSHLEKLNQAISKNDFSLLKLEAHSMKGELGNLGAVEGAEIAKKIEALAAQAQITDVQTLVSELMDTLKPITDYIDSKKRPI